MKPIYLNHHVLCSSLAAHFLSQIPQIFFASPAPFIPLCVYFSVFSLFCRPPDCISSLLFPCVPTSLWFLTHAISLADALRALKSPLIGPSKRSTPFSQSQRIRYSVAPVTNLMSGYRYCFPRDHTTASEEPQAAYNALSSPGYSAKVRRTSTRL